MVNIQTILKGKGHRYSAENYEQNVLVSWFWCKYPVTEKQINLETLKNKLTWEVRSGNETIKELNIFKGVYEISKNYKKRD